MQNTPIIVFKDFAKFGTGAKEHVLNSVINLIMAQFHRLDMNYGNKNSKKLKCQTFYRRMSNLFMNRSIRSQMTIRYKNIQIETLNILNLNTIFFDYYFHNSFFIFLLAAKNILDKILDF